ncbi:uncharacterized protein LOC125650953 [Ostrea edulis]|uniref:uncharacterized protein LOC125650953 n=1 Tax=Ostrea edulis TaxID=37623 RepID=UPI0024AEEF01|nr:uncharacterized protein LOC125650953 [Ostrea edulis]
MPVLVIRISDQDGADILSNTATNFTGGTFSELFEKCVHSKNITLSTDSIVEIRLREDRQAQFMLADNADMDVSEIAATLGCKFVQFIITRTLALTSSNSCHEHNPAPGDEHRPSAQVRDDPASVNDRINREIFKTQKVRDVIVCGECSKPRCVYSDKKLTREQEELLLRLKEEHLYTCGDSLVPEDVEDPGMVVREAVNCLTEVETSYFSTSLKHYLPPVCVHCGKVDNLLDDTDPYISALYEKYSVVRPLCEYCKNTGKDARTWGKKFLPKKCKR